MLSEVEILKKCTSGPLTLPTEVLLSVLSRTTLGVFQNFLVPGTGSRKKQKRAKGGTDKTDKLGLGDRHQAGLVTNTGIRDLCGMSRRELF